jgi:hypothetical protein
MHKIVLASVIVCLMLVSAAQAQQAGGPADFAGTWQGVWQGYGAVKHPEKGSQSSLTLTLTVKAGENTISGMTETGAYQHDQAPSHSRPVLVAAPHIAPPPPPLPDLPPSGKMLHARIEGRTLAFEVKGPDGMLVEFRLNLQHPDAAILDVTHSAHARAYPEFQMKRVQS